MDQRFGCMKKYIIKIQAINPGRVILYPWQGIGIQNSEAIKIFYYIKMQNVYIVKTDHKQSQKAVHIILMILIFLM